MEKVNRKMVEIGPKGIIEGWLTDVQDPCDACHQVKGPAGDVERVLLVTTFNQFQSYQQLNNDQRLESWFAQKRWDDLSDRYYVEWKHIVWNGEEDA